MEARPRSVVRSCLLFGAFAAGWIAEAPDAAANPARLLSRSAVSRSPVGGGFRTQNFVVRAPSPQLAREIAESAEAWRKKLAIEWLGQPLASWPEPCTIDAKVHPSLGAGGATTFIFDRGRVFGWEMSIQGSRERVLDSVLPHEVTHTIFASHFRQPLPRWADEGACTTVEHRSEVIKQERMLIDFLKSGHGLRFSEMFAMKEYPDPILPLYAQGHSVAQYLIERRGKREFLAFIADGLRDENWPRAVRERYGHESLYTMQEDWLGWVRAGRPKLALDADIAARLADASGTPATAPTSTPVTPPIAAVAASTGRGTRSVYARNAAAQAGGNRSAGEPGQPRGGSVYDASRGRGTTWR